MIFLILILQASSLDNKSFFIFLIQFNKEDSDQLKVELRGEREKNKKVERELRIKEKALAEAAALLVLRKNVHAIWGDQEEE